MKALDAYYDGLAEPLQGYMLAVRKIMLDLDEEIESTWKWSTPFFLYRKRMLCYLWVDKKTREPYLGIYGGDALNHPSLVQKHRAKIRKLMLNVDKDIPAGTIRVVLGLAMTLIRDTYSPE